MTRQHASAHARNGASPTADPTEEAVLKEVSRALRSIEYGSVLIKIHQGRVVGIETSTKVRLEGG